MERDAFLAAVRDGIASGRLPDAAAISGPLVWGPGGHGLVDQFAEALHAVDGVVHRSTETDPAGVVVDLLLGHGARRCLVWPDEATGVIGLSERLAAAGIEAVDQTVPHHAGERIVHQLGYDDVTAGITGADAGLAESGSIVLSSGSGRSRMASLIPPIHVALVRAETIYPSLSHWAAAHPDAGAGASNVVIITGPSRTGDIETHLNLGVHGPRHLHVVVT